MKNLKSINIICREWFDKANGNSYFSAKIHVNAGLEDEQEFILPFGYGYGEQFLTNSAKKLQEEGFLPADEKYIMLPRYCRENGIVLTYKKYESLKRDMYK